MKKIPFLMILLMASLSAVASAQNMPIESDVDPSIFGLEIEKLLNLGSGILALGLFMTTFIAHKRSHNKRLVYVSTAFLLFAVKGFLTSLELFGIVFSWIDPMASFLNFAILLSFFFGVAKK
jgi:hypothetical protein